MRVYLRGELTLPVIIVTVNYFPPRLGMAVIPHRLAQYRIMAPHGGLLGDDSLRVDQSNIKVSRSKSRQRRS